MSAISVKDLYARTFFTATIPFFGDSVQFTLRRLEVNTVLWEGVVTLEMVNAADRFMRLREMTQAEGSDLEIGRTLLEHMDEQDKQLLLEFLSRFVVAKVVEPRLTLNHPPEEGAFPVRKLPFVTLVTIFATMPDTLSPQERLPGLSPAPAEPVPAVEERIPLTDTGALAAVELISQ